MKWSFSRAAGAGGRFQLVIGKLGPGGRSVDVTTLRGAPTQLNSFSSADPFGDSTAVFSFPSVSPFDDLQAPELAGWLGHYANVDLYWVPAVPAGDLYLGEPAVLNALTGLPDVLTPASTLHLSGGIPHPAPNRVKIWEGYLIDLGFSVGDSDAGLQAQCQGALFQHDHYLQKPFYPARPYPLETLIQQVFDRGAKPHLRTQPLRIQFPAGWSKIAPPYVGRSASVYSPVVTPGAKWTGYTSRSTGAWDRALTGFVQDQLAVMITDEHSGVAPGNQWTVQHARQSVPYSAGRQPVLQVRDRFRAPDFALWVGTPGLSLELNADGTQIQNVIYGDGTDTAGTVWRNAVVSSDGSRTDYLPLAADRNIYPYVGNPNFQHGAFASEGYQKYGAGFAQDQATSSAQRTLGRDRAPGWSGTLTLATDPGPDLPRWLIRAGMTVLLQGFAGSGETGVPLHIAAVEASPMTGTVSLTVDTRYRDLLNIEESLVRTRDPLTPSKMLQVNRASAVIEDIQAPWDYSAGSGCVPRASHAFFAYVPSSEPFPYSDWALKHPPLHYPSWYVKCNAAAPSRAGRWAGPVPVLTSEKGTVSRSEFFASDVYGRPLKVPFHLSFYYVNVTPAAMPRDGNGPSPYLDGAFESVNPATGQAWPAGNFFAPDQSYLIGWGNRAGGVYQRAGFSPGRESDAAGPTGAGPTGLLIDEAAWNFDNTNNPNYNRLAKPGQRQLASAITVYAMFYCEFSEPVYFMGRLFRQSQGL